MISYGLTFVDGVLRFWADDEKTVKAIKDYAERYIESENYRRVFVKCEPMKVSDGEDD